MRLRMSALLYTFLSFPFSATGGSAYALRVSTLLPFQPHHAQEVRPFGHTYLYSKYEANVIKRGVM